MSHPKYDEFYFTFTLGPNFDDIRFRRWCSTKRPNDVSSSSSTISIRFTSDGQGQGRGFQLSYWEEFQVADPPTTPKLSPTSRVSMTTPAQPVTMVTTGGVTRSTGTSGAQLRP